MHCGVAHHAALADLASLRLELRLDQRDQAPAGRGEIERRIEHLGETDEARVADDERSEEHTSELQSLMRISYAVFCLKKKKKQNDKTEYKPPNTHHSKWYT